MSRVIITKIMKQLLTTGGLSLLTVLAALAADPLYINDLGINSPPDVPPNIDAFGWLNRATFSIDNSFNFVPQPYETKDTLYFTNTPSGQMFGFPGFRFLNTVGSQHYWMDTFTNNGTIATDSSQFFSGVLGTILIANSQASLLIVQATNIASTGPLRSGAQGIISLEGKNINLKRNGLRTGAAPPTNNLIFSSSFLFSSNYVDDAGISDLWWGAGTNNNLNNRGLPIQLSAGGQFSLPFPSSPVHQVVEKLTGSTQLFTNTVILPQFSFFGNYGAAVWTNQVTPSNFVVQVVFYPTNSMNFNFNSDTNFTTEVRFIPDGSGASVVVVAFNSTDFDIVDNANTTTSIYLSDALATVTNVFLARNLVGNTRRPDTMEISRNAPFGFNANNGFLQTSLPTNAIFDTTTLYKTNYRFATVTNLYAAYAAQIASVVSSTGTSGSPTNFPGRIQITGENVDLNLTRIRAETSLSIKATKSLTSNRVAQIDAPFVSFDVRSVSPPLVISNIAPANVRRLSGTIAAWSGTWKNFETLIDTNSTGTNATGTNVVIGTNEILFHVLIVDPSLQSLQPVVVYDFAAHAADVVISDTLNIGRSFLADGQGLEVRGGVIMPYGTGWARSNIQNVVNFTNSGTISIPQIFTAGTTNDPYFNYINHGSITAGAHFIHTLNFENSGNASIVTSGGLLQLDTLTASMMGAPLSIFTNISTNAIFILTNINGMLVVTNAVVVQTNVFTNSFGARMQGNSDIQISADQLVVSNSFLQAGAINRGSLILAVTNWICDSAVLDTNRFPDLVMTVTNHWSGSSGFSLLTRPANTNLFGTYLTSIIQGLFQESFHSWCAEDRGATTNGYDHNLAVGKLTLDGAPGSLFHFSSPEGQTGKAMYVDYLELKNFATNYNQALDISSDFTIYFANANVNPAKLNLSNGGHLRWVQDFFGPLSYTNILYPSGQLYPFNVAVVQSRDLDSDGDGVVNADDPTPFCECATDPGSCLPGTCGLVISMSAMPHQVQLFWRAPARSTNRIEYIPMAGSTNWHVLTNIVNGPTSAGLMVVDPSPMSSNRFYRLHQDLQH